METTDTKEELLGVKKTATKCRAKKALIAVTIGLMGGALAAYKFFKSKVGTKKDVQ